MSSAVASIDTRELRAGLWAGAVSFVLWGLMPLYWHVLKHVPSLQIVLHRIVWSALLVGGVLLWTQGRGWLGAVLAQPRTALWLALSSLLIGFNWGLYIWAVNAGHVIESSLGYFINPLLSVLLGVLVLRERLRAPQWGAVALATAGVAWLTWQYGRPPWIALGLASSFALYGLIRKQVAIDSVRGLGVESVYLFLPALAWLAWGQASGASPWPAEAGFGTVLLLVGGGALTALPLVGFAYAVRRAPLSVIGLMQYIAPTLQFLIGWWVFGEAFDAERAVGFAMIWAALAVLAVDGGQRARRAR